MKLRRIRAGIYTAPEHEDFQIVRTDWDVPDQRYAEFDQRPHRTIYLWEISHQDQWGNWCVGDFGMGMKTLSEARKALEKVLA